MTIQDLERNDADGAEKLARRLAQDAGGALPAYVAHYLFMLQDDQQPLRRRLSDLEISSTGALPL